MRRVCPYQASPTTQESGSTEGMTDPAGAPIRSHHRRPPRAQPRGTETLTFTAPLHTKPATEIEEASATAPAQVGIALLIQTAVARLSYTYPKTAIPLTSAAILLLSSMMALDKVEDDVSAQQ